MTDSERRTAPASEATFGAGLVKEPRSARGRRPKKVALLYPWLISLYPVVALLGQNVDQVSLAVGLRPLALSVLLIAVGVIAGRVLLRDWAKAAALATLGFVLFFSYGHVYSYVERINATGWVIGRHRYLLPLWTGLLGFGAWRILRAKDMRRWSAALNAVAGVALAIPVLRIGWYEVRSGALAAQNRPASTETCALRPPPGQPLPDVYYIILDGYMRDDILREVTGFDNTPFLNALTDMGFVVARESQSNYPWTEMSLGSSLNLAYLQDLRWEDRVRDWGRGRVLITDNAVRRELECLGYSTVAFESSFYFTEWLDADYYLTATAHGWDQLGMTRDVSEFEWMWVNTSMALALGDAEQAFARWFPTDFHERGQDKRDRVLFELEQLRVIASERSPKLVFAHIGSPHSPFVFGPSGEHVFISGVQPLVTYVVPEEVPAYWRAYADEVAYLNEQLRISLAAILATSSTLPIIVIQGDHGYLENPPAARMPILNAYYLPGGGGSLVYDEMSPVNTFRLIFTHYFGGDYELLDDISYCPVLGLSEISPDPCVWTGSLAPLE